MAWLSCFLRASISSSFWLCWRRSWLSRNLTQTRGEIHPPNVNLNVELKVKQVHKLIGNEWVNRLTCWPLGQHRKHGPGPLPSSSLPGLWPPPSSPSAGPVNAKVTFWLHETMLQVIETKYFCAKLNGSFVFPSSTSSHHWCFRAPHWDSPVHWWRHTDPADLLWGREGRWEGWQGERGEGLGCHQSGRGRLKVQTPGGVSSSVALGVLLWGTRDAVLKCYFCLGGCVCLCVCVCACVCVGVCVSTSVSRLISRRLSYLCSSLVNSLRRPWYFLLSSSSSALRAALAWDTAWVTHSAHTPRGIKTGKKTQMDERL